jgi:hypothetical protein
VRVIFHAPVPVRQEKNGFQPSLTAAIIRQVTGAHGSLRARVRQFCGFYRAVKRGTRVAMRRATVRIVSQVSEGEISCEKYKILCAARVRFHSSC